MSVIELKDVGYTYLSKYNKVEAIKNASGTFEKGKFYAIVGRSGSGKTTLLSLMAGLDRPTKGEIYYDGKSLKEINADEYRKRDISVIYQSFQLLPLLTALENVMFPMELLNIKNKEAKEKAMSLIEEVGIDSSRFNNYPKMLSGGEQQRIAIARALATSSKVILADEPTGNLDTENGNNVIDILMKLAHDKDYCVIVITHDLSISEKADCIYRMQDGVLLK